MRHTFTKSINQSQTSIGGMHFENNNTHLNLNDGLDYVNIVGNFLPLTINSCFLVVNNSLTLLRTNKFTKMNLLWEFTSVSNEVLNISFRVKRVNFKGDCEFIESTKVNSSSNSRTFGQTIISVNSNDKYYMQIRNVDSSRPTSNILITSAELVLTE
jgi:hypothetical protein